MAPVTTFRGGRLLVALLAIGVLGAIGVVVGVVLAPARTLLAYTAAYTYAVSIAVGALILLMIGYAANARWMAAIRRVHEIVCLGFPALAVLFVPIALGLGEIYVWADPPAELPEHEAHLLHLKAGWLSGPFFVVRAIVYLAVWIVAAELLRRWSRRRDGAPIPADGEAALGRERAFASAMLPAVGLAVTFAAFDWLMSLQPTWYSSMFGVYVFAGGFVAAIGLVAVLAFAAMRRDAVAGAIGPNHFHALGRLLFAFTVFWAYTAYFQVFLIQIANRPEEVTFYLARTRGGWTPVAWVIAIGRFVLPFFLLLPRRLKFRGAWVAGVATWILVVHFIEIYWLVLPVAGPFTPHWIDLAALAAVVGLTAALCAWRQRDVALVADGDPFLPEGTRYASPT